MTWRAFLMVAETLPVFWANASQGIPVLTLKNRVLEHSVYSNSQLRWKEQRVYREDSPLLKSKRELDDFLLQDS